MAAGYEDSLTLSIYMIYKLFDMICYIWINAGIRRIHTLIKHSNIAIWLKENTIMPLLIILFYSATLWISVFLPGASHAQEIKCWHDVYMNNLITHSLEPWSVKMYINLKQACV